MATAPGTSFHCEVEQTKDENDFTVTVVKCQGRLVGQNADEIGNAPIHIQGVRNLPKQPFAPLSYSCRIFQEAACIRLVRQ